MPKITANSKAKHLTAGKEYEVTAEIAELLKSKGWTVEADAEKPKKRTRKSSK